jgi:myo-inositol-1(or 4)-monophosphatase
VVDPIDGTVNFLYNIPHYAVSIAAVTGDPSPGSWQVEAGAVFNPATGELFHAARGEGAFLGERRLQIGPPPPMNLALLATGFAYSTAMRKEQVRILSQLIGEVETFVAWEPHLWILPLWRQGESMSTLSAL